MIVGLLTTSYEEITRQQWVVHTAEKGRYESVPLVPWRVVMRDRQLTVQSFPTGKKNMAKLGLGWCTSVVLPSWFKGQFIRIKCLLMVPSKESRCLMVACVHKLSRYPEQAYGQLQSCWVLLPCFAHIQHHWYPASPQRCYLPWRSRMWYYSLKRTLRNSHMKPRLRTDALEGTKISRCYFCI